MEDEIHVATFADINNTKPGLSQANWDLWVPLYSYFFKIAFIHQSKRQKILSLCMFILTFTLTDLSTNNISRHLVWNEKQTKRFWRSSKYCRKLCLLCHFRHWDYNYYIFQKLGLWAHNKVLKYTVFNVYFFQRRQIR